MIRVKKSALVLDNFLILKSKLEFSEPEEDIVNPEEQFFGSYTIDFDFTTREEGKETLLFAKIEINTGEEAKPGYSIFVESMTILSFTEQIDQKHKLDLIFMSGLNIAISSLRNYIINMTSYGPFGKYILPMVDLPALHQEKRRIIAERKAKLKQKKGR